MSTGYDAKSHLVPGAGSALLAFVQSENTAGPWKAKSIREAGEHTASGTTPMQFFLRLGLLLFVISHDSPVWNRISHWKETAPPWRGSRAGQKSSPTLWVTNRA